MKTEEVVDAFMRLPENQQRVYLASVLWFLDPRTRLQFEALLNGSALSPFLTPTPAPAGAAVGGGETAAHAVGSGEAARGSGAKGAPVSPDTEVPGVALRGQTGRNPAVRHGLVGTEAAASVPIPTPSKATRPPERVRTSPAIAEDSALQNERAVGWREAPLSSERMIPLPEGGDRGGREFAHSRTDIPRDGRPQASDGDVKSDAGEAEKSRFRDHEEAPAAAARNEPLGGASLGNTAGLVPSPHASSLPVTGTGCNEDSSTSDATEKDVASCVAVCRKSPSLSDIGRRYFTLDEVARKLGVSRRTVERDIRDKRLPRPFKIRGRSVIRSYDLRMYEWKLRKGEKPSRRNVTRRNEARKDLRRQEDSP